MKASTREYSKNFLLSSGAKNFPFNVICIFQSETFGKQEVVRSPCIYHIIIISTWSFDKFCYWHRQKYYNENEVNMTSRGCNVIFASTWLTLSRENECTKTCTHSSACRQVVVMVTFQMSKHDEKAKCQSILMDIAKRSFQMCIY